MDFESTSEGVDNIIIEMDCSKFKPRKHTAEEIALRKKQREEFHARMRGRPLHSSEKPKTDA